MLAMVPGVGYAKARALTTALHGVHGVLTAERRVLLRVPGIGRRIADRLLALRTP
jgi:ERCC4-type nuclease